MGISANKNNQTMKLNIRLLAFSVLAVGAAHAATTTITGTTGGNNSWNEPTNWDVGVPSGTDDAIIGSGVLTIVDSLTTPSYAGTLTLEANSTLRVRNNPASESLVPFNAIGTGGIIMKSGSTIDSATRADPSYPAIDLQGNGTFLSSDADADRDSRAFNGAITGSGSLTVQGRNVEVWSFNTTNNFSGGLFFTAIDRYVLRATVAGAFGAGNVTLTPRANADLRSGVLNIEASNVFAPTALVDLSGTGGNSTTGFYTNFNSNSALMFLAGGTTNTVSGLTVNGAAIPGGTYTGGDYSWLLGTGSITVVPEPSSALLGGIGMLALLRRRR